MLEPPVPPARITPVPRLPDCPHCHVAASNLVAQPQLDGSWELRCICCERCFGDWSPGQADWAYWPPAPTVPAESSARHDAFIEQWRAAMRRG